MAADITVPTLGESVTTATIARWIKKAGDTVAADEPVVELETDKVTVEVNAPQAGVIAEIIAAEGAEVEIGALLGRIGAAQRRDAGRREGTGPCRGPHRRRQPAAGSARSGAPPRRGGPAGRFQADGGTPSLRRRYRSRHRQG